METARKENNRHANNNMVEAHQDNMIPMPTPRELEIIQLAMQGFTTKAIAAELYIEQGTVEVHRSNIIRKLRCGNLTAAVAISLNKRWIKY